MRRGRFPKRPSIKRWGWVKKPGFQIRLAMLSNVPGNYITWFLPLEVSGFLLSLQDFMSLCSSCNGYLRLGVVRIKTLRPYVGSWYPYIWYRCPPSLCRVFNFMFFSPTIKKLLENRAKSFVMLESRLCTLMSGLGTLISVLVPYMLCLPLPLNGSNFYAVRQSDWPASVMCERVC